MDEEMAALEDGCCISVGGLLMDMVVTFTKTEVKAALLKHLQDTVGMTLKPENFDIQLKPEDNCVIILRTTPTSRTKRRG